VTRFAGRVRGEITASGFTVLAMPLLLAACGTPNFGSVQTVRVDTEPPAAGSCTLANAETQQTRNSQPGVAADFIFEVPKSSSPLSVTCVSADGRSGSGVIPPEALQPFTGSSTVASVFGSDVDETTGMTYRYPEAIRVRLSTRPAMAQNGSRLALSPMLASRVTGTPVPARQQMQSTTPTAPSQPEPVDTVRLQTLAGEDQTPPWMEPEAANEILETTNTAPENLPPAPELIMDDNDPARQQEMTPTTLLPADQEALPEGGLVQPMSAADESALRAASLRDAAGLPPLAPLQPTEPVELPPIAEPLSVPSGDVLPRCAFGQVVVPAEADTCLRSGGRLLD